MTRDELRAANRAAMPETARIIDDFRRVFGNLPAGWCEEGGKRVEWGTFSVTDGVAVPASQTWPKGKA